MLYIYAELYFKTVDGDGRVKQIWNAKVDCSPYSKDRKEKVMEKIKSLVTPFVWEQQADIKFKVSNTRFSDQPHY